MRIRSKGEVPIYYHALTDGEEGVKDRDGVITSYVRISHQVYNTFDDYCKLRDAINELVERKNNWLKEKNI